MPRKPETPTINWDEQTKLIHNGVMRSQYGETSEAIFMNSGFCYDSAEIAESRFNGDAPGFVYSRYSNPNLAMLEQRLADMEGAESCNVMASGMAAVFAAIMCQVKAGDRVVASRALFSSCHYILSQVLPRFGVNVVLVDGTDITAWQNALSQPTACVFIETPSNPTLEIIDITEIAKLCHIAGARLIVDNVFASPLLQKPLELGADLVVYSTTKHMDGQGRCLGGAVLGYREFMEETLLPFHRHTGPAMSPFNAWLVHKSLETFPMRMERHVDNAEAVADFLCGCDDKISRVIYPGLANHPQHGIARRQMKRAGALVAFEMVGGKEAAFKFLNALELLTISNNLGDARSLVAHPATTTHASISSEERASFGITDGMIRLSAGLEATDDILNDIKQALSAI
ncbi:MAG: O-succinylhomoserine sulfhydrylase [Alphaproteobacteria bacterium]|nr:O-succinylhomoserine sulfhydrylase [Alphaproteobacteria bacterium]